MRRLSACRKSMFFQQKCLSSIPIRTLCGLCVSAIVVVCCRCVLHRPCSTTCMHPCIKPLGVLSRHPCRNPKPLSLGEGLCMLSWLCIVQSIWAYTPGVRAGLSVGLPPSPRLGLRPKPRFLYIIILKGQQKWLKFIYPSKKYVHSPRSAQ